MTEETPQAETAYLVLGGELADCAGEKFAHPEQVEIVGVFADYDAAHKAWRGRTMETVDNALQRYCIIGLDTILRHARKI